MVACNEQPLISKLEYTSTYHNMVARRCILIRESGLRAASVGQLVDVASQ